MVRELDAVVTRDEAAIGILLTLEEPTKPMHEHRAQSSIFIVEGFAPIPRIQIVTVEDTFRRGHSAVNVPLRHTDTYEAAPAQKDDGAQSSLL